MKKRHVVMNLGASFTAPIEHKYPDVEFIVQPYEVIPCSFIANHIGVVLDDDDNMEPAMLTVRVFKKKNEDTTTHCATLYAYGKIIELKPFKTIRDYVDTDDPAIDYVSLTLPGADGKSYRMWSNFCEECAPIHWVEYYQGENFRAVAINGGVDEHIAVSLHQTGHVAAMFREAFDELHHTLGKKGYEHAVAHRQNWDGLFTPVIDGEFLESALEETIDEVVAKYGESKPILH